MSLLRYARTVAQRGIARRVAAVRLDAMEKRQLLQALVRLRTSRDIDALNSVLLELFDPCGPLKSFSVSFNATKESGFCILQLVSPLTKAEARAVGGLHLGKLLCLEFSLEGETARSRSAGRAH